jgi:hypothetical protein
MTAFGDPGWESGVGGGSGSDSGSSGVNRFVGTWTGSIPLNGNYNGSYLSSYTVTLTVKNAQWKCVSGSYSGEGTYTHSGDFATFRITKVQQGVSGEWSAEGLAKAVVLGNTMNAVFTFPADSGARSITSTLTRTSEES